MDDSVPKRKEETGAPARGVLLAVFVLSLCAVAFEVSLLRTFAFVFRYHYLFLIVSLAICGYGLGALAHYVLFRAPAAGDGRAGRFAALFALSLPLTLALVLWLGVRSVASSLLPVLLLPVLPFFLAGMSFAELFGRYGVHAARLYAYDLAGAAVACVAGIALLAWLGGVNAPLFLGILGGGSALLLVSSGGGRVDRLLAAGGTALAAALLVSNVAFRWLDIPPLPPDVDPQMTKPLLRELSAPGSPSRIVETRWSAFARVDLVEERGVDDMKYVYTDGDTPTHMLKFGGDLDEVRSLMGSLTYVPFEVARPKSVLAIGPGGGMDVLMALLAGATRVDGVEISGPTIDLVHDHRAFSGDPYHLKGVQAHVMDGRSFVTSSRDTYDLIYSALTLTATSGRAGMAHTESYIHTLDAFQDYWRHLTANGVFGLVLEAESLTLRAFLTALEVVRRDGKTVPQAMEHLALVTVPEEMLWAGPYRRLLLLKRSPFTPDEARALMRGVQLRELRAAYVPHELTSLVPYRDLQSGALTPEQFVAGYHFNGQPQAIAPVTDDRPFFVFLSRELPDYFMLMMRYLVWITLPFALVPAVAQPWLRRRRPADAAPVSPHSGWSLLPFALLFALLGAGFMLLEIPMIQQFILFLGHPTLSLAVVLFALLLGTALGSAWTQRWSLDRLPARVALAALAVAGISIALFYAVPALQQALAGTPVPVRVLVAGLPVGLLGIALGMPFPSGLRLVRLRDPSYIPWAWGINGLMSVFGSVLAMSLALTAGFRTTITAGAAAYLLVAVLYPLLPRAPGKEEVKT